MSKTKILRYIKVMISKFFFPAGDLILIFIKRMLPTPEQFEPFKG